jgi:hypothetical protein
MAIAITCTALALAAINIGIAVLIVFAIGARTFAPLWVGVVSLVAGIALAAVSLRQWQTYLAARRY